MYEYNLISLPAAVWYGKFRFRGYCCKIPDQRRTLLTSVLYALEKRNPIVIIMAQTPNTHTLFRGTLTRLTRV